MRPVQTPSFADYIASNQQANSALTKLGLDCLERMVKDKDFQLLNPTSSQQGLNAVTL